MNKLIIRGAALFFLLVVTQQVAAKGGLVLKYLVFRGDGN